LLAALRIKDVSRFPLTFMAFLGSTSYSIYLWHMYSIYLAHKTTSLTEAPFNYVIYYFLSFVYAFSIGSLMHFFPCPKSSTINT
jgi:peptidoglycan/LPS O-acetylase OafA/YrhL